MAQDDEFGKEMAKQWGPDQIKDILGAVSEKIPELMASLTDVLYGKDNAEKYGAAVAHFYKSMVEAGMSPEQAFELTQRYMSSLSHLGSIAKMMGDKKFGGNHNHGHGDE
jgi:hypothetical protein